MGHHASGQGDVGFNTYAEKGLGDVMRFWETNNCRQNADLEEYQQAAAAACHPSSPIRRLLVDYRMGAGKTKIILQILDFHFEDERKKVPAFPMQPAIDNMFDEMLKWPGKYRSDFALAQPLWAAKAVPLRLSASEQERNLENDVLRKRLDASLCINRHKWSNKSVPSTQTMVWEGPKKGSRHNPPLPECRATPRKWLADATLLCQSISIWRASAPYSYMLTVLYILYTVLYSHDMS
jgi:hypothetical protein